MELALKNLSNQELETLTKDILLVSAKHSVTEGHLLLTEVKLAFARFHAVFSDKSFNSDNKADSNPDYFAGISIAILKSTIKSMVKSPSLYHRQDAYDLYSIIEKTLSNNNLQSNKDLIDELVNVLEEEENQNKLRQLNIISIFKTLKKYKNNYEQNSKSLEKNKEERSNPSLQLRQALETAVANYFSFVGIKSTTESWSLFYNELIQTLQKNNKSLTTISSNGALIA